MKQSKQSKSKLEDELHRQLLHLLGDPTIFWLRNAKFCPNRNWRSDFLFLKGLIIEVEGGGWKRGRHHRPQGFEEDCRKYLAAMDHGYRVIRVTGEMVKDGTALEAVRRHVWENKRDESTVSGVTSPCHQKTVPVKQIGQSTRLAKGRRPHRRRPGPSRAGDTQEAKELRHQMGR